LRADTNLSVDEFSEDELIDLCPRGIVDLFEAPDGRDIAVGTFVDGDTVGAKVSLSRQ